MKYLLCLALTLASVVNISAAGLIFNTKVKVERSDTFTEIVSLAVGKYKKLRIGVRTDFKDSYCQVKVSAREGGEYILLDSYEGGLKYLNRSSVIEVPPETITVEAIGKCTFSLFIWAE